MSDELKEQSYVITGMDCASCAQKVATGVNNLDGVEVATLNFTTGKLRVQGDARPQDIVRRVHDLGYDVAGGEAKGGTAAAQEGQEEPGNFAAYLWSRWETRLALLAALLIIPGLIFHELLPGLGVHSPLIDLMSVAAMLLAGYPIALSAWRSLRINHNLDINALMTIAAVGAVIIGAYTEAGLVMVLFALGEALEGYTAGKARNSIRELMAVAPQEATVLRPCFDCREHLGQAGYEGGECPFCGLEPHRVPVAELAIGETIVVKPGERIAMDGQVLSGDSAVNQAPITGESKPVEKHAGAPVFAGSINGQGTLEVTVSHLAADNTISRMISLVEEAQEQKAPAQRFVDSFARIYTPLVVVLAALVAIIPPLLFDQPFWVPDDPLNGWLYRALALLVVACPCALVISTPVSIISAISNGARHGILFKGGAHVEALSHVRNIAFDKTGTLTKGQLAVVDIRAVGCAGEGMECAACDDLLALASAVEQRSEHPMAVAVVERAAAKGLFRKYQAAGQVKAMAGQGVTGKVNGHTVTIGSHQYFDREFDHDAYCQDVAGADAAGYSTMLLSRDDEYLGYLTLADEIRPNSRRVIEELKKLGMQRLVMLTGDNEETAQGVAREVGVTEVRANCLPEDKVTAVEELRDLPGGVAMVGDGINDTPALATATVGIAIGSTAQAMETADVTLMGNDLQQLPFAVHLSQATMRTIWANVVFAIGIKVIFLLLIMFGYGSMWLAVFADMGAALLVTLNGMRLLRSPRYRPTD